MTRARLDLYLVHWPCRDAADTRETWRHMEALATAGTVRRRLSTLLLPLALALPLTHTQVGT
jgi:aryl-alcohol dehydrogenase-like predicted oxidoreductase